MITEDYRHGAILTYTCGIARQFKNSTGLYNERWQTAMMHFLAKPRSFECQWDKSWSPAGIELDPCQWVQCINPPQPPRSANLVFDYQGVRIIKVVFRISWYLQMELNLTSNNKDLIIQLRIVTFTQEPVEFHENVSYSCNSDEVFFEHDRDSKGFNITCLEVNVLESAI